MVVPISIDATAALAKALRFMALPIPGRRRARQFAGQPVHLRQAGKIGVQRLCHHLLRGSADNGAGKAQLQMAVGIQPQGEGGLATLRRGGRSEEHTSELQSLMRISYAVFCLKKKNIYSNTT